MSKYHEAWQAGYDQAKADTEITNRQAYARACESVLMDLLAVHEGRHECTRSIDGSTCPAEFVYNKIGDAVHERLIDINANIVAANTFGGPNESA